MYPHNENPAQQCAITHTSGPIQVLAGPGSGKTHTIVKRIRYLIEVQKIPPGRILVITFTKAAALEMQSRFLTDIRRSYSAVNFGTFHSIYYQILSRSGYIQDITLIKETEKLKTIRTILHNIFPTQNFACPECTDILNEISRIKNGENPSVKYENMPTIYEEYNDLLKQTGKMDFDDMILHCHEILSQNKKLQQEWQQYFTHILVDEFQDINRLQYQVLKLLAAPHNRLFTVGDDDQSIYGFRGAKPAVMKEFLTDFPECRQVILDINYRSTHPIVEAADKVIACNQQRLKKHCRALRKGNTISIHSFQEKEKEESWLLEQISALPQDSLKESAVILRTNQEVSRLAMKCPGMGIPVRTTEKIKDIFAHFIGMDILDYIHFACQSKTRGHFLNIMNKPMRYLSRKSVADLSGDICKESLMEYYRGNIDMQNTVSRFFADCDRIAGMSPYLAVHYIRKGIGYDRCLKERARSGEYEEWMEIAGAIQESARNCKSMEEWMEQIQEQHSLCEQAQRTSGIKEGIRLITMHGSKGLEFHTVFIPHLNEGTIPGKKCRTTEQIEEERRLFYVAMTRAKEKLYLTYTISQKNIPSRFLEPLIRTDKS